MIPDHPLSTKSHIPPAHWSLVSRPRFRTIQTLAILTSMVGFILAACTATVTEPFVNSDLDAFTVYLDERMPKWLQQYRVPGAAVALVRNGEVVWTSGYGLANKAGSVPVTPNTVFQGASISKTVTAWNLYYLSGQFQYCR